MPMNANQKRKPRYIDFCIIEDTFYDDKKHFNFNLFIRSYMCTLPMYMVAVCGVHLQPFLCK